MRKSGRKGGMERGKERREQRERVSGDIGNQRYRARGRKWRRYIFLRS